MREALISLAGERGSDERKTIASKQTRFSSGTKDNASSTRRLFETLVNHYGRLDISINLFE